MFLRSSGVGSLRSQSSMAARPPDTSSRARASRWAISSALMPSWLAFSCGYWTDSHSGMSSACVRRLPLRGPGNGWRRLCPGCCVQTGPASPPVQEAGAENPGAAVCPDPLRTCRNDRCARCQRICNPHPGLLATGVRPCSCWIACILLALGASGKGWPRRSEGGSRQHSRPWKQAFATVSD